MRRSGIKKAGKAILFISIGIVILCYVSYVFTPQWIYTPNGYEGETSRYYNFYQLKENTLDYLTLGSSQSYYSTNPMQIYAETGYTGYNLGNSCQTYDLSYYWLKEALKYQSPKYVFLDVTALAMDDGDFDSFRLQSLLNMRSSPLKLEAIMNCSTSTDLRTSLLFPLYQFHRRWNELTLTDFQKIDPSNDYPLMGSVIRFPIVSDIKTGNIQARLTTEYTLSEADETEKTDIPDRIDQTYTGYFEKIAELCRENNITLVPTKYLTLNWSESKNELIKEYLLSLGLDLFNLYENPDIGINWDYDTADNSYHNNYWGAAKASHYIAEYLKKEDRLTDHRDDPYYDNWNEKFEQYCDWEEECIVSLVNNKFKDYNFLNQLADNKDEYLTIVSVKDDAAVSWNSDLDFLIRKLGINDTFTKDDIQSSFIAVIDSGENLFELKDDEHFQFSMDFDGVHGETHNLEVESGGFPYGNISSIKIDGIQYSANKQGLNIVAYDKNNGEVAASVAINTHEPKLEFTEKTLSPEWTDTTAMADGFYTIHTAINPGYVLGCADDVRLALAENKNAGEMTFQIENVEGGFCLVKLCDSEKYLTVEAGGDTPETHAIFSDYIGTAAQKWYLLQNSDDSYNIISLYNGLALEVPYGDYGSVTELWLNERSQEESQNFVIECIK